ncbi:MAG: glycoside hydrolase family 2 protein [Spirochaetia bacterium]|nr:glycoside hydrolase family 2 protein [Spirochaetia bacterium]
MYRYTDLAGSWNLREAVHGYELECSIPGDLITPLIEHGLVEDPYVGTNELKLQWIGTAEFTITRSIYLAMDLVSAPQIDLVLEQVDLVAQVFINDQLAGTCSNGFRTYRFPVKKLLKRGENHFEIRFGSAEREALRRSEQLPYAIPHQVYPVQSMHRNLVRKVQCHSGWDWGPCLMVSGIYRSIGLEAFSQARMGTILADTLHEDRRWKALLRIPFELQELSVIPDLQVTVVQEELGIDDSFLLSSVCSLEAISYHDGSSFIEVARSYHIESPKLWWPSGYGDQYLYTFSVSAGSQQVSLRLGFRTVRLDHRDDQAGRALTVVVNGKAIFCKGANWIPTDALPSLQTDLRYRQLLEDAKEAHMNMIRVWGGGQYEKDIFYDLCDELGILIWQDCMFSCSLYPATPEFLDEVRHEIEDQIRRSQHHPSIALWCGNNEDVGSLIWFEESRENRDRYLVDYDRLNEGVLGQAVRTLDPHRPWWPSSPSGGPGDYSDCWHDDTRGDMHYWSVWHEGKPFESYREVIPRFCSEFGFQSFAAVPQMRRVIDADQMNISSPQMLHHQKNEMGNAIILQTMARYFRMPSSFEGMVYLSAVQQAYGIRMAIDYWRANRPRCMGALYWQLNDLWPVASWSSIEYSGRWKMLHHEAVRFFAPLALSIIPVGDQLHIFGINDTEELISGTLQIRRISCDGNVLEAVESGVTVLPEQSTQIAELLLPEVHQRQSSFLHVELCGVQQWYLYALPQEMAFSEPTISCSYDRHTAQWAISTDVPAFYVWLECDAPGHFSDNGFHLLPGETRRVSFSPSKGSPHAQRAPSSSEEITIYDLYHAGRERQC